MSRRSYDRDEVTENVRTRWPVHGGVITLGSAIMRVRVAHYDLSLARGGLRVSYARWEEGGAPRGTIVYLASGGTRVALWALGLRVDASAYGEQRAVEASFYVDADICMRLISAAADWSDRGLATRAPYRPAPVAPARAELAIPLMAGTELGDQTMRALGFVLIAAGVFPPLALANPRFLLLILAGVVVLLLEHAEWRLTVARPLLRINDELLELEGQRPRRLDSLVVEERRALVGGDGKDGAVGNFHVLALTGRDYQITIGAALDEVPTQLPRRHLPPDYIVAAGYFAALRRRLLGEEDEPSDDAPTNAAALKSRSYRRTSSAGD